MSSRRPHVLMIQAFPIEGVRPVSGRSSRVQIGILESGCLGMQPKAGGKLLLRLNTMARPIANKYREGKLKSTLKREFNST